MRKTQLILSIAIGLVGLGLIVRGAWGGIWPLSVQLLFGVLLTAYAGLRWRMLRH